MDPHHTVQPGRRGQSGVWEMPIDPMGPWGYLSGTHHQGYQTEQMGSISMQIGLGVSQAKRAQLGRWDGVMGRWGVASGSRSGIQSQGQDHRSVTAWAQDPGPRKDP